MKLLKKISVLVCVIMLLVTAVVIPASAVTIFEGDFGFVINGTTKEAELVEYKGSDTVINVPSYYKQFPVTTFDEYTFKGNTTMTDIHLPETIAKVPNEAFLGCTALQNFSLPSSVRSIGSRVFQDCTSLSEVTFLPSVPDLPDFTFAGCTSLQTLNLNGGFRTIGMAAFRNCSSLSDLSFLQNVESLQSYSFSGTSAASVDIPSTLSYLPNYSFTDNTALKDVYIPRTVTFVEPYAFDHREDLTVHCYYATPAQDFAILTGLHYVLMDGVKLGDVNGDGLVNINDVTMLQRYLAELENLSGIYYYVANVTGDDAVTISDATAIQMYIAEYPSEYLIGEVVTQ